MRPLCVTGLVLAMGGITSVGQTSTRQPTPLSAAAAAALYERGEFDAAVLGLDTRGLMATSFTRALEAWVAEPAPSAPRRRVVAAAFALDAAWFATRTAANGIRPNYDPWKNVDPDDPDRWPFVGYLSQPIVARWAVELLPATGVPDPLERLLWLAAVGIAEDGHAWYRLQRDILPLARRRLLNESRFRLADVLARTNRELGSLRAGDTLRNDILRVERLGSSVSGRIGPAVQAFEPLLADPTLSGEVALRIGYLELRRRKWPDALARFDAARASAAEPTLLATIDYFSGWIHEQAGHRDEAIEAYRRAIEVTPTMRNLATRLSAQLFLRNDRAEAYAVLDRALTARPAPVDLLVAIERGDARLVPAWLTSIRSGLR